MHKMSMSQKILAKRADKKFVSPGEQLVANIDLAFAHDPVMEVLTKKFYGTFGEDAKVWDHRRIALFQDHLVPAKDIKARNIIKVMEKFVRDQNIQHYFPYGGNYGVCHIIMMEQALAKPGEIICGTDSHTVTYGSFNCFATGVGVFDISCVFKTGQLWFTVPDTLHVIVEGALKPGVSAKDIILLLLKEIKMDGARGMTIEWSGSTIDNLSLDERSTLCNMAVEAGATNSIMALNSEAREYMQSNGNGDFEEVLTDFGYKYAKEIIYDAEKITSQIALPSQPDNVSSIDIVKKDGVPVHQVYVGGCTGGKLDDILSFYEALEGQEVSKDVTVMVVPATTSIFKDLFKKGVAEKLFDLGVAVETPGCKACYGVHGGVTGDDENCLATINRNFIGRMGNPKSNIYLCSPYIAAKSAIAGIITD